MACSSCSVALEQQTELRSNIKTDCDLAKITYDTARKNMDGLTGDGKYAMSQILILMADLTTRLEIRFNQVAQKYTRLKRDAHECELDRKNCPVRKA